ncbi:MAG: PD-(D/E)XK nuclease family protein [Treponema sp.]
MKIEYDKIIKDCISENIKNQNAVFVFPTQICASMWCDKSLEFSGVTAVALERFIAWDDFKGSSIRSRQQDKNAVPSAIRSIFAENLIKKNSEKPFFKNIIAEEFAKNAGRFSSWIASVLPSLAMWKKSFDSKKISGDEEDADFLELYERYRKFLDENNLFDPAWETPPFESDGKKYFIFFPEILMDYSEYKEILESSDDIRLIFIPQKFKDTVFPEGYFYANSRIELKEAVHYLRKVHDEKKIGWDKIAVSVPDLDTYAPYLERELELYQIPHILKNGKALSSSGAGRFFNQIKECCADSFSYESVKSLLLNKELPWKEPKVNDMLIFFGRQNNCICSYEYGGKFVDVWEESFKHPLESSATERLIPFYSELKKGIQNIVNAKTFSEIRTYYFAFREKFFDFSKPDFSEQNDKILSRCISELGLLIDLEEKFKNSGIFEMNSSFSFFCSYLDDKMYVPQNPELGVQILPYRTACCAPFDVHVVVDASQGATSVIYRQLPFLDDCKRRQLGFAEDLNVSQDFILLYEMSSQKETLFTCAEKTFDAYAFMNNYLKEKDCRPGKEFAGESFTDCDSYAEERKSYLENSTSIFPEKIFLPSETGFKNWSNSSDFAELKDESKKIFHNFIDKKIVRNKKVRLSVSALNKFFECPRSFLLGRIYDVQQESNVAELIDRYEMGNLNHKIMELFCLGLKNAGYTLKYNLEQDDIPDTHKKILKSAIDKAIEDEKISHLAKSLIQTARKAVDDNITSTVLKFSEIFNEYSVAEVETNYEYNPKDKNYFINARIDCLLVSPNGEYVLIDFKNKKTHIPKNVYYDAETKAVPDFQLPVYKYILEHQKNLKNISAVIFFDLTEASKKVLFSDNEDFNSNKSAENNALFDLTQKKCLELIDDCADLILKYDFSPEKIGVDYSTCRECVYKSICRRTFTVGTKHD